MIKEITFPFNLSGRKAIYFVQKIQDLVKNPIYFEQNNRRVNAKSLLGVLSLNITGQSFVSLIYENEADLKVMEEIINLIKEEF